MEPKTMSNILWWGGIAVIVVAQLNYMAGNHTFAKIGFILAPISVLTSLIISMKPTENEEEDI
jgi:hypothetical protein